MPFSIDLVVNPNTGKGKSGYSKMLESDRYPTGYYTSSVMPMTLVRPSLSNGVGTYNPDYYGYVGRETQIRICIQGGAFPFIATIQTALPGATISNDPMQDDYLVLKFTPTQNGTFPISINVHDQEQNMVKIRYNFTVSESWCVFCSPTGSNTTGTGTKANPWLSIQHAFATVTDGRCLILEDGTYTDLTVGNNLASNSCGSMVTWNHNNSVIIDMATNTQTTAAVFYINKSNTVIQGLTISNPPTTLPNPRIFSCLGLVNDIHLDNTIFNINGRMGSNNGDNVSCLFFGDPGGTTPRRRITLTRCEYDGLTNVAGGTANGWSAIDTYQCYNIVIAKNKFRNQVLPTVAAGLIWIKGTRCGYVDIYQNEFQTEHNSSVVDVYLANTPGLNNETGSVDVAFNLIRSSGRNGIWIGRSDQTGNRLPVWTRRNTIIGGMISIFDRNFSYTYLSDGDVIQSTQVTTEPWKISIISSNDPAGVHRPLTYMPSLTSSVINYECHGSSNVVDSGGNLINSYATYIGRRGHVVQKP